ncbi:MAG TPA: GNAT family N-acetyltransferase [Candidatus Eisenbacteria bacterium]|nr:GNAT family N-acetyltransferase [Candidatus Eisenbacteria bacterium]
MTGTAAPTTGWEPGLPVDDTVLRRFVFSHADRMAKMAQASGGPIGGSNEAAFADPGSPFLYDNGVVLLQPPTPALIDIVCRQARTFFPPDHSWTLLSAWPTPDLAWRGLELAGHPLLLLRPPGRRDLPSGPPPVRIVEATSATANADFEHVLVTGYPALPRSGAVGPDLLGTAVRRFVGYLDGRPVTVAGAAVGHGLVEIDWVATVPDVRRRGFGAALTAEALRSVPDLPAVLLAGDEARSLYERLGFLALLRTTVWCHRPATVPPPRGRQG